MGTSLADPMNEEWVSRSIAELISDHIDDEDLIEMITADIVTFIIDNVSND